MKKVAIPEVDYYFRKITSLSSQTDEGAKKLR